MGMLSIELVCKIKNGKVDIHGLYNQCMVNLFIRCGVGSLVHLKNELNKIFKCNEKTFV